jgi:hypothetical protein
VEGAWYSLEPATSAELQAAGGAGVGAEGQEWMHVFYANDQRKDLLHFCGAHSEQSAAHNPAHVTPHTQHMPHVHSEAEDEEVEHLLSSLAASTGAAAAPSVQALGSGSNSTQPNLRYLELLVVNDYTRYTQHVDSTESNALAIANRAAALFTANGLNLNPPLRLVLIGQITWRTADPYTVCVGTCNGACPNCAADEVGVTALLSQWHAWRSDPQNTPYHDAGFLLSGYDFEAGTIGFAGIGTLCNYPVSGGVVQTRGFDVSLGGFILTHELGMSPVLTLTCSGGVR